MKSGTVAIVLAVDQGTEEWVATLSDEREIETLSKAVQDGNENPLDMVYNYRQAALADDESFGDFVEELLTHSALKPEIRAHGLAWFRSKNKIEKFRVQETEAAEVIGEYALQRYAEHPEKAEFILEGPGVEVWVKIFKIRIASQTQKKIA